MNREIYATREEWLNARMHTLGASDAAASVGLNPWKTNVQLWKEKTGKVQPEDISEKACIKFGNDAEPLIRAMFALEHPEYTVVYVPNEIITSSVFPFLSCSLDGEIITSDSRRAVLEIKTAEPMNLGSVQMWKNRIPDHYLAQVIHQLFVTDYDFVVVRAHIRQNDGAEVSHDIERFFTAEEMEEQIEWLIERETKFWDCVKADIPPSMILPNL